MTKTPYLKRLDARNELAQMKRRIVFGLLVGWIMTLLGAFNYYFVQWADDTLWGGIAIAGLLILLITIVFPAAFTWPERLVNRVGNALFTAVFWVILSALYIVFFLPIGFFMRRRKGGYRLVRWKEGSDAVDDEWSDKEIPEQVKVPVRETGKRSFLLAPFGIFNYFMRRGHFLLMPLLLLLIFLGFILIFLQTSAVAPMIYTFF